MGRDDSRPWQIIPKDSPIILFFYSQIFSLLFSQTSPLFCQTSLLFLHYSQTHIKNFINILMIYNIIIIQKQSLICNSCIASWQTVVRNLPGKIPAACQPCAFKFNLKTAGFGKLAKLHCSATCSVQVSVVYCGKETI